MSETYDREWHTSPRRDEVERRRMPKPRSSSREDYRQESINYPGFRSSQSVMLCLLNREVFACGYIQAVS
jgi:hypothetical protein